MVGVSVVGVSVVGVSVVGVSVVGVSVVGGSVEPLSGGTVVDRSGSVTLVGRLTSGSSESEPQAADTRHANAMAALPTRCRASLVATLDRSGAAPPTPVGVAPGDEGARSAHGSTLGQGVDWERSRSDAVSTDLPSEGLTTA